MKITYEIPLDNGFGEDVLVLQVDRGTGKILKHIPCRICPVCGLATCVFENLEDMLDTSHQDEVLRRFKHNAAIDAVEQLALAHACNDVNIVSDDYIASLNMTLRNIRERYPE